MEPASVVYPADINLARDGGGRQVLALTLPRHVTKLFVDGLPSVAAKCSVYRLSVGSFAGFVILQTQSHQIRVVVPLYDKKSFLWLEQCSLEGNVSCAFNRADASAGRQFVFPVDLPALGPSVLNEMHEVSDTVAQDVLLVIASSVPSMSQPHSVASLLPGTDVEEVHLCIVRDFFNTYACLQAAVKLMRRP